MLKQEIINTLKDDHRQLMKVLYQLDQHLLSIKKQGISSKNIEPVLNILDYVQVYPEIWHHPVEDIIFSRLLDKLNADDASQTLEVTDMIEEHGILEALTLNLQGLVSELGTELNGLPVHKLSRLVHHYINTQLKHIEKEQNRIFPMVSAHFAEEDWEWVAEQVSMRFADKPFNPELEEYQALVCHILNSHPVTATL